MSDQVRHLYLLADFRKADYRIEKGPAMQVHPSVREAGFYPADATFETDYETAYQERVVQALNEGKINNGRFEDRKPRFAGLKLGNDGYVIFVGPSHFGETQRTNVAAINDRDFYNDLLRYGIPHTDPRAFFAYTFATNAVPVSEDGHVLVFRRSPKSEIYPSHWQDIGGMLDTDFSFWGSDAPSVAFRELAYNRMEKELDEEGGILSSEMGLELTGLVDGLSTVDFTYVAEVRLPSGEILERRRRAEDANDHTEDRVLRTSGELHDFLLSDEPLSPVGVGAMLIHLREADQEAYDSVLKRFEQYPLYTAENWL